MPRYIFHVHHDGVERDRDGRELTDKHVAWEHATRLAGETIRHIDGGLRPGHDWKMEVTDEFANTLWELHVKAKKSQSLPGPQGSYRSSTPCGAQWLV